MLMTQLTRLLIGTYNEAMWIEYMMIGTGRQVEYTSIDVQGGEQEKDPRDARDRILKRLQTVLCVISTEK